MTLTSDIIFILHVFSTLYYANKKVKSQLEKCQKKDFLAEM